MGSYLLQAPMGGGGTGMVFEAIDSRDGSPAAVKVAHDTNDWQREILRKEIALLARLGRASEHAGVVKLLEHGADGDRLWYAMELVRGADVRSLAEVFARDPTGLEFRTTAMGDGGEGPAQVVPARRSDLAAVVDALGLSGTELAAERRVLAVLRLVARIARAVAFVHGQAVVHADLAPSNIIVRTNGMPVLVDFGTSFYTFIDGIARETPQNGGRRHGTAGYMAPEQIRGEPLDARCDLYALGCICYELLTGQPPFTGDAGMVQRLHLEAEVPPPSTRVPVIPREVDDLVLRLLSKDSRRRIGFAEDVVAALAPWSDDGDGAGPASVATGFRLYRSRLHGRSKVFSRLQHRLEQTLAGQGGFVLVTAESGLGKTRLLNEIGTLAAGQSVEVIVGQCRGSNEDRRLQALPLEPMLPVVRRLADQIFLSGQAVSGELGDALAALRPFDPSVGSVPGMDAIELPRLPVELARDRVLRGLLTCVRALAAQRPTLILVDDLQWADELTKAFVTSARIKELARTSALMVATYREEEADAEFVATCDRVCDERLRIGRLERTDISAMAHDMTAAAMLPEGLVDDVFHASEGNPFFAAECLRSGLDEGLYRRDRDGHWYTTSPPRAGHDARGRSLARYLTPRLARLTRHTRRVAELAAILGREFEVHALLSLVPQTEGDATRAAIEELTAHRLLEEPTPGTLRFVHDKLREGCEEVMSTEQRQSAHRAAAVALQEVHDKSPSASFAARLGRHWVGAGEPERAALYLEQAARAFVGLNAIDQAAELYGQVLEQLEVAASATAAPQAEFATRRAMIAEELGDLLALRAKHTQARERYLQAGHWRQEHELFARARISRKLARSFWTVHQYHEATSALTDAESMLASVVGGEAGTLEWAREKIEVAQNHFWIAYFGRRFGPALDQLLVRMERETAQYGTVRQRGIFEKCAAMYQLVHARFRPSPAVIEHSRRSLALLGSDSAYAVDAVEARFSLGFALVSSTVEDCEEALPLFRSCADSAELIGDMTNLARALAYSAVGLRRLGRVEETVAMAERARYAAQEAQLLPYLGVASSCLAWAEWRRSERHGDQSFQRARLLVEEARRWWDGAGHPFPFRWLAELVAVALAESADDPPGAVEPLSVLGRADQFHLPDELDLAIISARDACAGADLEKAQRHLGAVLLAARRAGF